MGNPLALLLLTSSLAWPQSTASRLVVGPFTADDIAVPPAPPERDPLGLGSGLPRKPEPFEFGFKTEGGRTSVGVSVGLAEGKPLEVAIWGGGGAIAGSLAGPLGAIVGAGTGAVCGLLYSVFVVPHNGPENSAPGKKLQ